MSISFPHSLLVRFVFPPMHLISIFLSHTQNDAGSSELGAIFNLNIFTTFIKARISCTSGTGTSSDIPFHYNEIQDTFFVPSGSSEGVVGSEEQLFAVFNSARLDSVKYLLLYVELHDPDLCAF